jgi:hypothetical protein
MKTRALVWKTGLALLAAGIAFSLQANCPAAKVPAPARGVLVQVGSYKLSGPYKYENLTLFLIHGADQFKGKTLMTLQEAMGKKLVIVHETKNVNQLTIENLSKDVEVFVQSGDIVKGGQQDRTIAFDLILPPKSGQMPITSYCVEQGRWSKRGAESAARFGSAPNTLPSKEGKIAVKGGGARKATAQEKVWMEVARKQRMLSIALGKSVKAAQSGSSLQLSLEDKKLLEAVDTYQKKLATLPDGKKDVVGYAFAINGEINSADIYGSHELFKKLWPNLLKATVIEAIAEKQKDKKFEHVKVEAIKAFMLNSEKGKASNTDVTKRIRMVTQETKKNILFVTQDRENKGQVVRKNYIAK